MKTLPTPKGKREIGKKGKREIGKRGKQEKEKKGKWEKGKKRKREKEKKEKEEEQKQKKKRKKNKRASFAHHQLILIKTKTDSRNGLGRAPTYNRKILRRVHTQLYNLSICHQSIHSSYHL